MPFATINGIRTSCPVTSTGTPLLMVAPEGFEPARAKRGMAGAA